MIIFNIMEQKKGCNFCKRAKKKFSWWIYLSLYVLLLAIIGQVQVVKYIISLF